MNRSPKCAAEAFRFGRDVLRTLLCATLIAAPAAAQGQDASKKNKPVSELSDFNLSRVSATAEQIEAVLRKESALFLELKRWIAMEATNRGQIIEDADLADQAVLKRLREETEFRAAATRLLQRYGFLLAKPNPDSELAKERELVSQEKAKLIARAELEEENRLFQPRPRAQSENASERDRAGESRDSKPHKSRAPEQQEATTPAGPSRTTTDTESSSNRDRLMTQTSAPLDPNAGGMVGGRSTQEGLAGGMSLRPEDAARFADLQAGNAQRDLDEISRSARREPRARPDRQRDSARESSGPDSSDLYTRPNPYRSIPSLYDLYRQAWPKPVELERFGAEAFRRADEFEDQLPMDLPVGPDYVVGPGDSLGIEIWGGISQRLRRVVDRDGRISLPEAGPVLVSGRTMGEVQRSVQQLLRTQFRDVSADVTLAQLRTIRVYVVGDVQRPGPYEVSSLSTPLNALFQASGPTNGGSFRLLRHYRGKQLVQEVDVYDLLLRGIRSDLKRLENGDTVLVPPLGDTVRVEGMVRRPAIYELRGEKSLAEVLELAGGALPTATLRNIQVQRLESNEKRTMLSVNLDSGSTREQAEKAIQDFRIGKNDEVRVFPIAQDNQDAVYLDGHVLRPGKYSFRTGMKVSDLFKSYADLLPEPATKYAEIVRLNAPDFRPSVESFDLGAALANPTRAPELKPLDTVRIFSRYDFEDAPAVWVGGEVHKPGAYLTSGVVRLRDAVHLAGGVTPDAAMTSAQVFRTMPDSSLKIFSVNLGGALEGNAADNIPLATRDRVVIHRNLAKMDPASVYIKGEVGKPGRYPLTTNMRVADLIRVAGGMKRGADTQTGDLTRFVQETGQPEAAQQPVNLAAALNGDAQNDVLLRDGDTVAIRQLAGWMDIAAAITVRGEVNAPGTFGIRPGEKLSSILKRAGGFRSTAYAVGSVLERLAVRDIQERERADLIRRTENEIDHARVSLKETPEDQLAIRRATAEQLTRALERLREAPVSGNLVVRLRADLNKFEDSADDIEVRAGDVLTVPKQPSHVVVTGNVYNPNAIAYRPGKDLGWYLEKAGGPTETGNKKRIFVVRANGSVVTGDGGWWNGFTGESIQPGDTIVVPEKAIVSGSWSRNAALIGNILSSVAVAAAVAIRR